MSPLKICVPHSELCEIEYLLYLLGKHPNVLSPPFFRVIFPGMTKSSVFISWALLFSGLLLHITFSSEILGEKSHGRTLSTTIFPKEW